MPSLKALKNRISTVKSIQKITKAMQMVAAAKLRRAQERAEAARPYAERMDAVLASLASAYSGRSDAPPLLGGTSADGVYLLIVTSAERGLCGGFNSAIARLARETANALIAEGKSVKIFCVGRKGHDILRRTFPNQIVEYVTLREVKQIGYANAQQIAGKVLAMFDSGEFDVATLIYSRFKSVISQIPTARQIIPARSAAAAAEIKAEAPNYDYEPDEGAILKDLLPRNLAVQVFRALLEIGAGEMGAKMTAMDNSTRNAGDMIQDLTLSYNRQRQAQITKELIEIISGAEAL
ncbi:MAG: F0F1 ATP synthase subunit gamma [Cucumibacter sp.]